MQKANLKQNTDIQDAMINRGAQTFTGTDKFHVIVSPPFRPVIGDNFIQYWHTLDYKSPNRGLIAIIRRQDLITGSFETESFKFPF